MGCCRPADSVEETRGKVVTTIKDSGQRQVFDTGAVRDCQEGKGRFDLIQPAFLWEVAKVNEGGAVKYGARNYEKGIPLGRYFDSAIRHLVKWSLGYRDEPHLAQAAWNIEKLWWTAQEIEAGRLPATLDAGGYQELAARRAQEEKYQVWAADPGEDCLVDTFDRDVPPERGDLAADLEAHLTDFQQALNYARQLFDLGSWNVLNYYHVMKINGFDAELSWRVRHALGTATWSPKGDHGLRYVSYVARVPPDAQEVIQ